MKRFYVWFMVFVVFGLGVARFCFAAKEEGYALCLTAKFNAADDYEFCYLNFIENEDEWSIPQDSFLEYDVFIPANSAGLTGGVDLSGGSLSTLRDNGTQAGVKDSDGNGPHPSGSLEDAKGNWLHRKFDLKPIAGESFVYGIIAVDGSKHTDGVYKAYYRNIQITDGKRKVLVDLFTNKTKVPIGEVTEHVVKDMTDYSLTVVSLSAVK